MRERISIDELARASVSVSRPASWKPALTLAVVLVFSLAGLAAASASTDCDTFTRKMNRPDREIEGVSFKLIYAYQAIEACSKAVNADPDSARLRFNLGLALEAYGRADEAVVYYRTAAVWGYTPAQYKLATAFANGIGVERDPAEAAKWLELARDHDNPNKQYEQGLFHQAQGSYHKAYRWYRAAAEQDHPGATEALVMMIFMAFLDGGVQDYSSVNRNDGMNAIATVKTLAEGGNTQAQLGLASYYEVGLGDLVHKDRDEAISWYQRAAQHGNREALGALKRLKVD